MKKANQKSRRNLQSAMQKHAYADKAVRSITSLALLFAVGFSPNVSNEFISNALGIEEIRDEIIQESTEEMIVTQPVITTHITTTVTSTTTTTTTTSTTTTTTEVTTTETQYEETGEEYYEEEYYEYDEEDYGEENYEYVEDTDYYEENSGSGQNIAYFEGTYYGVYSFDGVTPTGMGTSGASGNALISGGSIALNDSQRVSLGLNYGDYVYIESASYPSINGSYRIDDCGCDWGVIDFFYWAYTTDYMPYDLLSGGRAYDVVMYY